MSIDYEKIKNIFKKIEPMYKSIVMKSLRESKSFDELKSEQIKRIAIDARTKASNAVRGKQDLLNKACSSVSNFGKSIVSWAIGQNDKSKNNPRDCYWTTDMKASIPDLIAQILAVWTLSNASGYYECETDRNSGLMWGRNAQITAIICILCLDIDKKESKKLINNLVEVGTGEGKSVIMAVTAIVLALLDFDVYCACYSELLSKRDQKAFNDLFNKFAVQNNIQYQTFNNVLEQMINDGGDVREITKNIVLGDEKGDESDGEEDDQ
eukprot:74350_1